ncbi:hypothetical protein FRB90_011328 [Tulasnella sp. 427]|nr:hypothetical protein FRB90_011328 [Tulasnella sp. 427]
MTRTERSAFPRAVAKDRHVSKSGMDKSLRKSGGGAHNWGSVVDEYYEFTAQEPDEEELAAAVAVSNAQASPSSDVSSSPKDRRRSSVSASSTEEHANLNNDDKEKALAFRKRALSKGDSESCCLSILRPALPARWRASLPPSISL